MSKPPGGDPVATLSLPSLSTSKHGAELPASEHGAELPASEHSAKLLAYKDKPVDAEWREKERGLGGLSVHGLLVVAKERDLLPERGPDVP